MSVFVIYAAAAVLVSAAVWVMADRFGPRSAIAAVLAGLLWPLVVLGALQVALWAAAAKATRAIAPSHRLDVKPAVSAAETA